MTPQRRTYATQRDAILGSRWVRTVLCYRLTAIYVLFTTVLVILLLALSPSQ